MGLFSKKKGGTLIGNLIAKATSTITGGVIGGKRSALLQTGNGALINAPLSQTINGGILDEVTVTASPIISNSNVIPSSTLGDVVDRTLRTSDGRNALSMEQSLTLDNSAKLPIYLGLGLLAYALFLKK